MNTDNMLLSGETIDFGPCAFMDGYDSAAVFSSIDHGSRYAYRNQPAIAQWNLACLGQSLLPLIDADEAVATEAAQAVLNDFPPYYLDVWSARMRAKFGLTDPQADHETLIQEFLDLLEGGQHDFTLAFRRLAELPVELPAKLEGIKPLFDFPDSFTPWLKRWQERCAQESIDGGERGVRMLATNPAFIARNHCVEQALASAYEGDFAIFNRLHERLQHPFDWNADDADLATPPKPQEIVQQTFCGT
jgi:uncharacterized protein YdiU (UPF0061 family)